ncbi:MAG: hypothetical protein ABIL09_24670 [Gemmatimonadota bacterium]
MAAVSGLSDCALHFDGLRRQEVDVGLVSATWDQYTVEELRLDMHHHVESQEGLIGYWPFDDGGGLTAADLSGQGRDGELTNYQGSGYPAWVPGVFTEIDTTGGG